MLLCNWWTKKCTLLCSLLLLQNSKLPVVVAFLGMSEVEKTLPFYFQIFAQPSLVIAGWSTGTMWEGVLFRRAAADTEYSRGTGWSHEKEEWGEGGGGKGREGWWITSECWHLQVVHLWEGDDEGELVVLHVELEQSSAPNNLEAGQNNLPNVHVRNQDIAGHFPRVRRFHIIQKKGSPQNLPDVLKEAEIEVFILKPSELQVSINIGAVSVSVPENRCS